jgi:hypothetical protein
MPTWSWAAAAAVLLAVIVPLTLERRPEPGAVSTTETPAPRPPEAPAPAAPGAESAPKDAPRAEAQGPPRPARLDEAGRKRVERPEEAEAREKAAFAEPPAPATPAAPGPAQPTAAENRQFEVGPPAASALGKAEGHAARAPAAETPRAAGPTAVARAAPGAAPEAAALEGPAGQQLREPEEDKELAEALPSSDEARKQDSPRTAGAVGLRDADSGPRKGKAAALTFASLLAEAPRSADEARRVRERWRAFLLQSPPASEADEARVRLVEVGLKAWQLSNDPADLNLLKSDAEAYLRRDDAAQGDRVRRLLGRIGS